MRTRQLHVSPEVYEAYWCISRNFPNPDERISTPDAIADWVLRRYVNEKYPRLFEQLATHKKEVDTLEKNLIAELKHE
jgi:hypothetical protein